MKGITGFISVKVIAVIIGSSGIAMLGQLTNFSSIIMTLATGGIGNGVVKFVAEHKSDPDRVNSYLSTAIRIVLFSSFFCSIGLIFFAESISEAVFFDKQYAYVFTLLGFTITLYAINNFLISVVNGYKQFKNYVKINIFDSLSGLIFSVILVWLFGLKGALISAVTYQSIMVFVTFFFIFKTDWFSIKTFSVKFNKTVLKKYLRYSLMTIVTAITVPVSQLIVRSHIILSLSVEKAGWWEAMNRISALYLMVITTSLSVYYLPRLSEIKQKRELKTEIFSAYKIIIPILLFSSFGIYLFRDVIIQLAFSKDFTPIRNLFLLQLIGDLFKISSWLLAFTLIARSYTRLFILSEIIFSLSFIGLSYLLVKIDGISGVIQAYLLNYILYFIFMLVVFKKIILSKFPDAK